MACIFHMHFTFSRMYLCISVPKKINHGNVPEKFMLCDKLYIYAKTKKLTLTNGSQDYL